MIFPVLITLVFLACYLLLLREGRKTKQTLLENQQRLTDIINFLPDATWVIDIKGNVIAWNRASEELTGVPADKIIGKGNYEYAIPFYGERRPFLVDVAISPDPEQESRFLSFSRHGDTVEAEIFIPHFRPGGVYLWGTARRLYDSSGRLTGAIETVRDITGQKRLQEIMMQTEKMVMVGGLAAGMAHEINNPLGAILQNIQNIQRRTSTGLAANDRVAAEIGLDFDRMQSYLQQRGVFELLEMISAAGERAANIVAKLMSFSHKSSALLEPVSIEQLVNHSIDLAACDYDLKKRYDFRSIQITRDFDRNIPEIVVNKAEIEQAMINLIKNAIQSLSPAAEHHTPRITVRTALNGSYATIVIEDNGSGMPPEVSRRIFEPFYTTKGVGAGTGLGLAVTYALVVKNHHGSIDVDSTPGQGSRFTINLPLQEQVPL